MDERPAEDGQSSLEDFFSENEGPSPEETEVTPQAGSDKSKPNPDPTIPDVPSDNSPSNEANEDDLIQVQVGTRGFPQDLPPSFLLSIDYSGPHNKAIVRLYRPDTKEVFFWLDNKDHKPYFYTDRSSQEVESIASRHRGFVRAEDVELQDLLRDETVTMTKVIGDNPLAIGGRSDSIRNLFTDKSTGVSLAWEAAIRYQLCYTYDNNLVPGLMYKIENGDLIPVPPDVDANTLEKFKKIIQDDTSLESIITEYSPMFFTEVPDIWRIAIDIEVYTPVVNRVPDANTAENPVTAIGLSDNEEYNKCFVLKREGNPDGKKSKDFPSKLEIVFFDDEAEMLVEAFKIIDQYPLVLTFVGDSFDLKYLHNRAKRLRIDMAKYCPISLRGNQDPRRERALLTRGVHVDLYKFFANPSIKIYALSGAYQRENLDSIAEGVLGTKKLELSTDISQLDYYELAHYCWLDADLVMQFTQFENNLLLRLIVLLMRISRMSMDDVTRFYISSWIQSLFRQEHRSNGILIPRRIDIDSVKQADAQTEATIGGKAFKGAIVIDPIAGVHFNATVLDFASLYPTIMKTHNISYETVDCPHEECKNGTDNQVPETDHWTCTKRRGMISKTIGFFRDTRVKWFKPKSKDSALDEQTRNWYSVVERALKVFVNACLPSDEQVIVRTSDGSINKRRISEIADDWKNLEILSIQNDFSESQFGTPIFTSLRGFSNTGKSKLLKITLHDGRILKCTPNHVLPVLRPKHPLGKTIRYPDMGIQEIAAEDIENEDDLLVLHEIPLSKSSPKKLFLPDIIYTRDLFISVSRGVYKTRSYKTNQETEDELIQIINRLFSYSKGSKKYKVEWNGLSKNERRIIKDAALNGFTFSVKIGTYPGRWMNSVLPLSNDFFSFLGWYIAEGSADKNRVSISQCEVHNPDNCTEIESIIDNLGWPLAKYGGKQFVIHSNILQRLVQSLCGSGAKNKHIPIWLLNKHNASILIDAYFKGDGNLNIRGNKRYSTASKQLADDLVMVLGSLGRYVSIHRSNNGEMFRIVDTKGHKYRRKGRGLVEFNGTYPIRVKSIETLDTESVYDIETENGWFVTTNGFIVHNSYGVTGAPHFELFCMPAAESVTAYGRDAIQRTKTKAESMGIRVLYGDTDSVFLDNPTKEQQEELVSWSSKELGIELEVEKTYKYIALSDRKKNYIGVYKDGKVEVKGLSGKKRNTPEFAQNAFKKMLEVLSRVDDTEGFETAKEEIREIVNNVIDRIEGKGETYTPEELAFRIQLTKPLHAYDTDIPHVRAAKKLVEVTNDPTKALPGTIVSYIKTKGQDTVIPVELAKGQSYWIDKEAYIDILKSVFEQVLDSVGLDFDEFLGFTTLDQFF